MSSVFIYNIIFTTKSSKNKDKPLNEVVYNTKMGLKVWKIKPWFFPLRPFSQHLISI